MSVTADWHTKYAQGLVNTQYYWDRGNKIYHKESKTSSGE
jgi:hypothetical protein